MYKINIKNFFEKNFISILCILVLVFCNVFSEYKEASILSIIVFIVYLKSNDITLYIKYLAFAFMMFSAIAGTVVIEFYKLYLNELETYSCYVGSIPLLVLSYQILFMVFNLFENCKKLNISNISTEKLDKSYYFIIKFGTIITFIIYLIMFLSVIENAAFLLNIDRFVYASRFKKSSIVGILTNLSVNFSLFPLLSILYGKKVWGWVTICLYILYCVWVGNKFGPFFTILCVFCLVYYNKVKEQGKKKILKSVSLIIIAFIFLIIVSIIISNFTSKNNADFIFQRTAQQGQEWWKTYDICKGTMHPMEFKEEVNAIIRGNKNVVENIGSKNGIYRIMYLTAPTAKVNFKLSTGSLYTEAGFASAYYYFGFLGNIIFAMVMGIIIAVTFNGFVQALNNQDIIKMLIFLRFFQLERSSFSMFTFYDMFDVVSIVSYFILIVSYRKNIKLFFDVGKKKLGISLKTR
ncbi:MAG: O-antigen polysaccharide polymerase Wzy [Firmicutes bacterium]|nr:O-antigen polysaccharide polymerase Wzy [Bacillota bacterium]